MQPDQFLLIFPPFPCAHFFPSVDSLFRHLSARFAPSPACLPLHSASASHISSLQTDRTEGGAARPCVRSVAIARSSRSASFHTAFAQAQLTSSIFAPACWRCQLLFNILMQVIKFIFFQKCVNLCMDQSRQDMQNSLPTHCSLWSRGEKSDGWMSAA